MMSHLDISNDVPPSQEYEEYGVYDTNAVSLVNVPTIQYTGVSTFEVNGTTYYVYNVYEAPLLYLYSYPVYEHAAEVSPDNYQYEDSPSFEDVIEDNRISQEYYSQYSSSYYDSTSSDLPSNSAVAIHSYSETLCTSVSYFNSFNNSSIVNDISYTQENTVSFTETFSSSDNSVPSLNENVETNNQNISCPITQDENHTHITNEETVLEIVAESHINTPACDTQATVDNYDEYGDLQQGVEDSETDSDNDWEEHLVIHKGNNVRNLSIEIEDDNTKENDNDRYEECDNSMFMTDESKIIDWSVEVDDDDIKESDNDLYEECDNSIFMTDGSKIIDWSVEVDDDDTKECDNDLNEECDNSIFISDECKIIDWSVEVDGDDIQLRNNDLYEEYDNRPLIFDESKVSDWSVEVDDDDEKGDDHYDSLKVNLSSSNHRDPYNSTDVIKYLKDELYRYALSGHMSLKESIPVVDILPVIEEESESTEEVDSIEKAVDSLEYSEGKVLRVVEKDEVADIKFEVSQPFIESYDLDVEHSEEITENLPDLAEMDPSSVPGFSTPQQNQTNIQHHLTQTDETFDNEDELSIKETEVLTFKKDSMLLSSGEELEISVKNVKNLPKKADNIINAELNITQKHQTKKGNMLKLQKDSIKMMEELEAIENKSLCQNDRTLLKSGKEEEIRKELLLKKVDSNRKTNTIPHVPQKTEHHDECYTKGYVEKTVKSEEKVSGETKKKKFHNFRKWLSNLCCWMKKKT